MVGGLATAFAGCTLFDKPLPLFHTAAKKLPAINLPPDGIQLDVVFVERPFGDALIGPDLWRQVGETAEVDRETRATLRENGFRVGVIGTNPPVPLQKMLGLKSELAYEPDAEQAKQLVGRQIVIRSGGETEIQVSPFYEECMLEVPQGADTRSRHLYDARCLYRVKAERLQEGWARLDFLPQLHHGTEQLRHAAGEAGWQFQQSQRTETFFPQRFGVKLSVGEMVVVSSENTESTRLGRLFFLGPDEEPTVHRLLVVRLAGMKEPAAQRPAA